MAPTACILSQLLLFLVFLAFSSVSTHSRPPQQKKGLTIPLIHRDSPASPFYDPTISVLDYWRSVHSRSDLQHHFIQAAFNANYSLDDKKDTPSSIGGSVAMGMGVGEYFMKISIGTPPRPLAAMADITGDFIWVQCSTKFFDPNKSSTYKRYFCNSSECNNLDDQICSDHATCSYIKGLPDGSRATGYLANDNFSIPTTAGEVVFPEIGFGCADQNASFMGGLPVKMGIAGNKFSLSYQIDARGKFSHCFEGRRTITDYSESHLHLGDDADLFGNKTSLTTCPSSWSRFTVFYSPVLEDISMGEERLGIPPGTFERKPGEGCGIMLQSAVPITYLAKPAFDILVRKFKLETALQQVQPKDDFWTLCYNGTTADLENRNLPSITLNFKGLDVILDPLNLFSEVDTNTVCLLMAETDGISIIGGFAQQNKNVGYDLWNHVLTIANVRNCADF